jgi:DNA integrity scanning protein DisA with diadenylate cyclase activity
VVERVTSRIVEAYREHKDYVVEMYAEIDAAEKAVKEELKALEGTIHNSIAWLV